MVGKSLLVLAASAGLALADLTIQTPASLIQCQPALLAWGGGAAPYYVAVIPGSQASAAAIKDFGEQTGTSMTWTVDIPAGTSITLKVTDSSGAVNYNQAVTIQPGSSNSCLTAGAANVASRASASATSAIVGSASMSSVSSATAMAMSSVSASMHPSMASASASAASMSMSQASASASSMMSSIMASGSMAAASAKASASTSASAASVKTTSGGRPISAVNGAAVAFGAGVVALLL
ncbi:hypothetical protein IAU60_004163 [Kwoniella sp. DSM 27419]